MDAADIRQLFPGLKDTIYLNTATMNVGSAPAREAYELAVERWSAGRGADDLREHGTGVLPRPLGFHPVELAGGPALDGQLVGLAGGGAADVHGGGVEIDGVV